MKRVPPEILAQIRSYEAAASPAPWTAIGAELWHGHPDLGMTHRTMASAEDAILMAVLRSWIGDILADLEEAR